jgi:DNA topoisomerase IB
MEGSSSGAAQTLFRRRSGVKPVRAKELHFLNPVPIRLVHKRWIDKYTERRVSALADRAADGRGT